MRTHSVILPRFWTGPTGKQITVAGKNTRIVATYLLTCDHANMLGLYRLPLLYITAETGLKHREVLASLQQLQTLEFAQYDEGTEFIWVREMARIQLDLLPGESLKEEDKRTKGAAGLYKHLPSNPFLGPFYDRYADVLRLPLRRDFHSESQKGLASPLEAPCKGPIHDMIMNSSLRRGDTGGTKSNGHPPGFAIFWEAYPRKKAKGACESWWKKHQPDDVLLGTMLAKIEQEQRSPQWKKHDGQYIPFPATWLNQRRWEDENGSAEGQSCQRRVQPAGGRFLKPCGKPAVERVGPNQTPRCADCLKESKTRQENHGHAQVTTT